MKTRVAAMTAGSLAALLALPLQPARAEGFKALAKELSRAAQRAGIVRVAVAPFEPADASDPREGRTIAERLTTQIVRQGRVEAVERGLLGKVMDENFLGETGMVAATGLRRAGQALAADAIVAGTFMAAGNETIIDARIIDVRTGAILAAAERKADRDWFDPLGLSGGLAEIPRDPYAFGGPDGEPPLEPPPAPVAELIQTSGLRDSLSQTGCDRAAERVDALEGRILELKARYWAAELKRGLSMESLRYNPGSTISDPDLKRRFYDRLNAWYVRTDAPALTASEVKRFTDIDQKAFQLHEECGL